MTAWFIVSLPAFIYCMLCLILPWKRDGKTIAWEFDVGTARGDFLAVWRQYARIFRLIAWFSLAGLISAKLSSQGDAAKAFAAAAGYSVLFQVLTIHFFEGYLHSKNPAVRVFSGSSYTTPQYALVITLAASSVIMFCLALALWV